MRESCHTHKLQDSTTNSHFVNGQLVAVSQLGFLITSSFLNFILLSSLVVSALKHIHLKNVLNVISQWYTLYKCSIVVVIYCSVLFQEKPEYNEPPPTPILYQVALGLGYLELPQGTKSLYVPYFILCL